MATKQASAASHWIADRTQYFDSSGIRKVFDLAATMTDPINLSIGQPDFPVPEPIQQAAIDAIRGNKNGYALTQGMPVLREKLQAEVSQKYGHADRQVFVTSGTSGGLVLAMLAMINPGDEVIVFDPYFVMYTSLVGMVGGKCVLVDTAPTFHIDLDRVEAAITPRTKAILFNSPANPTGVVATKEEMRSLAELAARRNIALVSDEIYSQFIYDEPFVSPAEFNPDTLVIDGFSKTYALTGWRLGFAHGPAAIIQQMIKLQQYTFVCAPQPFQWAAAAAMDVEMTSYVDDYRRKRNILLEGLGERFEIVRPGGAFYVFPKAPWGTGTEFVKRAIENQLLIIPGNIFSKHDTHFRISYAATEATLERGIEVLNRIAGWSSKQVNGKAMSTPLELKRSRLVEALINAPEYMRVEINKMKTDAVKLAERADLLWYLLVQSAATLQNSRGWTELSKDPATLKSLDFAALLPLDEAAREFQILNAFRKAKVRYPEDKARRLSTNFNRIVELGGVERATIYMLQLPNRQEKFRFMKSFKGIGEKYGRNVWMDIYDPHFRDTVAVDERLKKVAAAMGFVGDRYEDTEALFCSIARDAGLEPWEVDRLIYNFKDYFLKVIE